jgi:ABC-type multidrug transport system fused ATPase/permease subunit
VPGADYLQTSFNYSRTNIWRNFGVVIAFSVLYILVTVIATETLSFAKSGGGALVFKKSKRAKQAVKEETADEEKVVAGDTSGSDTAAANEEEALESISGSESVFTWKDVEYTVPYQGGERKLLNKVNGYAKPGVMVALVGASGAGKSTLLNTLSQRQSTGVVSGEMLVDGKDLGKVCVS